MRLLDVISSLVATQVDWQDLLYDPGFTRRENEVIWENYDPQLQIDVETLEDLRRLRENGQYSFLFQDGSIIQIYYRYRPSGMELEHARLAFYRASPSIDAGADDVDEEELEITPLGEDEEEERVEWLRIEYAPNDAQSLAHAECHLHIGGLTDVRIGVSGVPTPRQFVEFIIHHFYPHDYEDRRLGEDDHLTPPDIMSRVNDSCFPDVTPPHPVLHFVVPR